LLASPALLLLAGALIVLRLVPVAAALGERVAARGRGITSVLAFAQVERNPARYSRMTLLLVLAVGLGLFALTFNAALTRNVSDRAAYSVGADVRTTQTFSEAGVLAARIEGQMKQLPGVIAVAPVYRSIASTTSDLGGESMDVLGIDPQTFARVAGPVSWRSDYASQSFDQLMSGMRANLRGATVGLPGSPMWIIVSQSLADQFHLRTGDRLALSFSDSIFTPTNIVVGAVVRDFPTVYPTNKPAGFIVIPFADYLNVITREAPTIAATAGPNEYWLRTTGNAADHAALLKQLDARSGTLGISNVNSLVEVRAGAEANPVSAGMRGLLLVGALTAALLAVLGSIVQSVLSARQRTTQFAILRTIGMAGRQITELLLGEQVVVYAFGLLGGTVLGLLLTTATLPFLQFSDTTVDPAKLGVPPYILVFDGGKVALFYAALIIAFVAALGIAARYASKIGLGKALRLGED
ncbi:MAG: FtsX-like permease family protein, partial [Ktedonobacterales bacterium]|nr:FtsX-like permease family protein [Ktedonobacterales bacterium]